MAAMSVGYQQLLDAAIRHLEELKAQGVKFVSLSPETLAALGPSPAQPAAVEPTVSGGPSSPPPQTKPASQSPVVQPQSNMAVSPVSPLASTQNPDPALSASSASAPAGREPKRLRWRSCARAQWSVGNARTWRRRGRTWCSASATLIRR